MRKSPRKRLAFTSPPVKVAKLDTIDDESEYIYTCTPLDMPVPMKDPDVHIDGDDSAKSCNEELPNTKGSQTDWNFELDNRHGVTHEHNYSFSLDQNLFECTTSEKSVQNLKQQIENLKIK